MDRDIVDSRTGTTARTSTEALASGALQTMLRRRRFIVDRRYQLRVSLLAVSVALVLLVLLNLSLFFSARQNASAAAVVAPELGEFIRSQDRIQFGLVLTGSLVFLVGVFLVSILETHRTAGAAYRLAQGLESLREGNLKTRIRLRRGDNLQEVASAINAMAGALHEQAWVQVESLEAVAARLEQNATDPVAGDAAREIRDLALLTRRRLD